METTRLAEQLRRSYAGGAWHGPSIAELLEGVTAEQAARKPLKGFHSIWELVNHLDAWAREVRATLEGKRYETLSGEMDWPPAAVIAPGTWNDAQERLRSATLALAAAIPGIDDKKLAEVVAGRDFSYYVMLHGQVQHNLYHAGQIVVLKRQL